ncbi:MAG: prepilin-type N-terminal cleavage/methylation domain-containing protein [Alphaproteobacteria bacterium]|nr:prepilin-type N-terminal cleavage/methylation domain-containing protein [Alphaproteobacteria bacterium]
MPFNRRDIRQPQGFTLVELSIILVIIGLLLGGVLAGQTMRRNQQLRAVGTNAATYMMAMNQFKTTYGYVAGDFPTATELWGRADGGVPLTSNCAAPDTTASVGAPTCNGDGNGYLNATGHEIFRAWQHLAASGLITGRFTGISPYGIGISIPKGPLGNTGYGWGAGLVEVNNAALADATYFDGDYTNMLTFGAPAAIMDGAALTPAETFELDTKLDDGVPATGGMRVYKSNVACAVDANGYNVGSGAVSCAPLFLSIYKAAK